MIVIIGASRGIGRFLFQHYKNEGKEVIGTYNSPNPSFEKDSNYVRVDVSNSEQLEKWVNSIKLSDITLINCAGINYNSFAHKSDIKDWSNVITVNLIGTFNVIRCFLPIMREQRYGRIVNLSSIVSQKGIVGTSAYAASKAGLSGMAKAIAAENATKNITINNLNLGYMDIGMLYDIPEEIRDIIKTSIPQKKFGDPRNICNAIDYLIKSDYITGTSIDVNGGLV